MTRRHYTLMLMLAVVIAALAFLWVGKKMAPMGAGDPAGIAGVVMPPLAGAELSGRDLFGRYCASCHGQVGGGSDKGPPLVHKIYETSHHGDESFFAAALLGARAHHWKFGDMPKVEGITEQQVGDIVAFVRKVQSANGIH